MTAALVLMDLQHGICRGELGRASGLADQVATRGVLANAARTLQAARTAGMTVVHVRVAFGPGYADRLNRSARFARYEEQGLLADGTPDAELCPEVAPVLGELVVTKGCVDPFIGTPLLAHLLGRGVRTVHMGGVATHMVVESAARTACDTGFDVTVLSDLCAAHNDALHEHAVEFTLPGFATVTTSTEMSSAFAAGARQ
jgi:biuret amidohydrolase